MIRKLQKHMFAHFILLAILVLNFSTIATASVILQTNVTVKMSNTTVKDLLLELQKQTKVSFVYNADQLSSMNFISVDENDKPLNYVLDKIFRGTDFTYNLNDKEIIITKVPMRTTQPKTQVLTLSGKVVDEKGVPIVGATIIEVNGKGGAISDDKGNFSLKVTQGHDIEISFVGFKTQQIVTSKEQSNMIIKMVADALAVDDVVVTGYFNRDKTGFAGAVTTITDKEISRYGSSNVLDIIGNLDASFKIDKNINNGSNPNEMPDFTIRGKGTFNNESTAPVFILDGFQVSAQYIFDMDMNRIKTISILKDASASILYGSRAANGVVVIETKAPEPGKLRVTYNFRPTVAIADLTDYNLMNAREKLEFERYAGLFTTQIGEGFFQANDLNEQTNLDKQYNQRLSQVNRGVDTYWLSKPLRNAFVQNHSLNVEGGDDIIRYSVNANYDNIKGVMKGSDRERFGAGFRLIYRIKDKITINNYVTYDNVSEENSPYGSFSTYTRLNPYETPFDDKGDYKPKLMDDTQNPLYDANLPYINKGITQGVSENLSVDWYATEDLRIKGNFKVSKGVTSNEQYTSPKSSKYEETKEIEKRGSMTQGNGNTMDYSGNVTAQYNLELKKHVLFFGVGGEIMMNQLRNASYKMEGFPTDMFIDPGFALKYPEGSKPSSSEATSRAVGIFANVNYIFDNRFFADASVRYDGNSRFGLDNKFATFWSVGAGWNIHNEQFWEEIKKSVNLFKIRGSYGITGNQEFNEYDAKTMYEFKQDPYKGTIPTQLLGYGNPNLRWQKQGMLNIGIDLSFFNSRLAFTANYYNRETDGSLTSVTVAPSLGFVGNNYTENIGTIKNNGFDISLVGQIFQTKDFAWNVTLQASGNKSKLSKISNSLKGLNEQSNLKQYSPDAQFEEGQSMSILKAVYSLGIDPATGKELYRSVNGGVTYVWAPSDKIIVGDTEPTMFGNINTNLFWKNWELNISAQYRFGGQAYNSTLVNKVEGADPRQNADRRALAERWKRPNDHTFYKNIADFSTPYISTRFVQDENYLNLSNFSLSYSFDPKLLRKGGFERLRLSFSMTDLFQLSSIKRERGLDYPFERRFVFGVLVEF